MLSFDRPTLTAGLGQSGCPPYVYLDDELPVLSTVVSTGDACLDVGSAAGLYS